MTRENLTLTSMRDLKPTKILLLGESGSGKSFSLDNIPEPEGVLYFDLDAKGLMFSANSKYQTYTIQKAEKKLKELKAANAANPNNPYVGMSPTMFLANIIPQFAAAKKPDGVTPLFHTFVFDTYNYLMALFELDIKDNEYTAKTASGKKDTQANWGSYKDYVSETLLRIFSDLPQHIICLNHINKDTGVAEISGSWKHKTIESSFNHVIRTVKIEGMMFDTLKDTVKNDLLTFDQKENYFKKKHAFKVLPHPDFDNLSEKTPDGMFDVQFDLSGESDVPLVNEAFIDNDIMVYLDRWYVYSQKSQPFNLGNN